MELSQQPMENQIENEPIEQIETPAATDAPEFIPDEPLAEPAGAEAAPASPPIDEEEIGRKWAERNGYRQPTQSPPPAQAPAAINNPYLQAREEARGLVERGQFVDQDWVNQRALEIQGFQMHSRLAAMEARMVAPSLASEIRDAGFEGATQYVDMALDIARTLVPDPVQQRDLAKLLAVGYESLTGQKPAAPKPRVPMPRAESGTPASPGVTINSAQRQVADSLARTFHGAGKATNAQIKQWLKEGFLDV